SEHAPVGIQDRHKLRLRLVTSFFAVGILLALVLAGDWGILLGSLGAAVFASRELFALFEAKGYRPASNLGIVACLSIMVLTYLSGTRFHGAFLTAVFVLSFIALIIRGAPWFPHGNLLEGLSGRGLPDKLTGPQIASISDVATTFLGILYTGWLPSFVILLRKFEVAATVSPEGQRYVTAGGIAYHYPPGIWLTYLFFAIVVATDVGAYFVGKLLGRHPLIGPLSPRKTTEGALGGLLSAVAIATLFGLLADVGLRACNLPPLLFPWWQCTCLAILTSITAQVSDLSESLIKRDVGKRDAAELIPGHGGMLDRVDSYLLSGAVAYWYILYFWKIFP
ncbi:MAG: phosphatidate cytidylyltransferase, partial [Cyanobacteria bacterium NC_groundwater_1444_Ag_S-0.65um_54_12]|nr:phosphatidate cytidylyltransferase [Cyanobacteria bacterium NC_groundwater_1444_Ag_S-0.65um_54_12]